MDDWEAVRASEESVTTVNKPAKNTHGGNAPADGPAAAADTTEDDAGVLPKLAPNDAAHTWGDDRANQGHDEWLRENKPPHWG